MSLSRPKNIGSRISSHFFFLLISCCCGFLGNLIKHQAFSSISLLLENFLPTLCPSGGIWVLIQGPQSLLLLFFSLCVLRLWLLADIHHTCTPTHSPIHLPTHPPTFPIHPSPCSDPALTSQFRFHSSSGCHDSIGVWLLGSRHSHPPEVMSSSLLPQLLRVPGIPVVFFAIVEWGLSYVLNIRVSSGNAGNRFCFEDSQHIQKGCGRESLSAFCQDVPRR